jgi:hypothetical protein
MAQTRFTCILARADEPASTSYARVTITDADGATARDCPGMLLPRSTASPEPAWTVPTPGSQQVGAPGPGAAASSRRAASEVRCHDQPGRRPQARCCQGRVDTGTAAATGRERSVSRVRPPHPPRLQRRAGGGDVKDLVLPAEKIDAAMAEAVKGRRTQRYSWAETGARLAISRQAAKQR